MLWRELRSRIHPSEVDGFARRIGVARIARNEGAFDEMEMLVKMMDSVGADIDHEIEKKTPVILATPQRMAAISKAVEFLDCLRDHGHYVEPSSPDDAQILKYLKLTRSSRPNSCDPVYAEKQISRPKSGTTSDLDANVTDLQVLIDEEYLRLQREIQKLRCALFSSCELLDEVRSVEPPTTSSIESFNKRLQTKEFVLSQINKARGASGVKRLPDCVRLNRIWE